jgi:hypothetical protein
VGLERGSLSLVSTIEELRERKSSGSGLQSGEYDCRDPPRWPRDTPLAQKLALTSPTSGDRSAGIIHSRTKATEFSFQFIRFVRTTYCLNVPPMFSSFYASHVISKGVGSSALNFLIQKKESSIKQLAACSACTPEHLSHPVQVFLPDPMCGESNR